MSTKLSANKTCFGKAVKITRSGEIGVITGFALHQRNRQPQFFVEYKAADGRAVDAWLYEDQITTEEA